MYSADRPVVTGEDSPPVAVMLRAVSGRARPVGTITRGTTNSNRLRRCDRWLAGPQAWRLCRSPTRPIVVDLGYGSSPVTAVELHGRMRRLRHDVHVVGIEIDPDRVAAAKPLERDGLAFRRGGFQIPWRLGEITVAWEAVAPRR